MNIIAHALLYFTIPILSFHAHVIFFIYYIGTIEQDITLASQAMPMPIPPMKFIESISRAYRHPKELIRYKPKENRPDMIRDRFDIVIVLTFNIKGNLQKDSLFAIMEDKFSLTLRLDKEFQKDEQLAKLSVKDLSKPIYTDKPGEIFMHWLHLISKNVI